MNTLAWEVFWQSLDVTSGELVNGAKKECENPLTLVLGGVLVLAPSTLDDLHS